MLRFRVKELLISELNKEETKNNIEAHLKKHKYNTDVISDILVKLYENDTKDKYEDKIECAEKLFKWADDFVIPKNSTFDECMLNKVKSSLSLVNLIETMNEMLNNGKTTNEAINFLRKFEV